MSKFSKLRTNCSSIRKTAEKINGFAEEMQEEIENISEEMIAALTQPMEVHNESASQ